jgi:hypothetical protein
MFWRGLKGAVLGMIIVTTIATGVITLLFLFQIVLLDAHNHVDQSNDLKHLMDILPRLALAGIIIGAIGGFAAKLPQTSLSMLTCLSVVGGSAILTTFSTAVLPRYKGSDEPSFILSIIGGLIGGSSVLAYGLVISKRYADPTKCDRQPDEDSNPAKRAEKRG